MRLNLKNKINLLIFIVFLLCFVLSASNKIRVGWPIIQGLQEYDEETNRYFGFNYDYLNKISQYNNFEYEFYVGTMEECQMFLKNGQIDLLGAAVDNSSTDSSFEFCEIPFGTFRRVWISKELSNLWFDDFSAFSGKKIGILNKEYEKKAEEAFVKENQIDLSEIFYESYEDIIEALNSGKIDIAQVSDFFDCSNYKVISGFNSNPLYFMVNKENPEIKESMEEAINLIKQKEPDYESELYHKYFIKNEEEIKIPFSVEEKEYLNSNPVVKVLYNQHYSPLIYKDEEGECSGFLRFYMDLISRKTGITFEYTYVESSAAEAEKFLQGGFDIYLAKENAFDSNFLEKFKLTQPFFQVEYSTFVKVNTNSNVKYIGLTKNNKELKSLIEKDGYEVVIFSDMQSAIKALEKGTVDGYLDTIYSLSDYDIDKLKVDGVELRNYLNHSDLLSIAVNSHSNQLLLSSLDKTIESISKKEVDVLLFQSTNSFHKENFTEFLKKNVWWVIVVISSFAITLSIIIILAVSREKSQKYNKRLRESNIKLYEAKKISIKADEEKSNIFRTLSHDIRTPMNVILNTAILAKSSIEDKKQTEDNFDTIEKTSKYLLLLINKLLDLSRLKEIDNKVVDNSFSLSKEVKEFSNQMKVIFSLKKQEFVFDIDIEHDYLIGDIVKIRRIIENLVNNAAKFTPVNGKVALLVHEKDEIFIIKVIDSGIGMTKEQCSHIFDAYYRVDNPEVNKTEGNGLGLLICKELVTILNGRIEVESTVGKGTAFTVSLKLKINENKKTIEKCFKEKKYDFKGKKILMVEDNRMNQKIMRTLLERVGISCTQAFNGREGVMEFKKSFPGTFDLIIMDIMMPIEDGISACKEIRALDREDSIVPIVGLSGNNDFKDFEKGKIASMNEYLTKPIIVEDFYQILEKLL